ncbi:MAG TPA: alpha-L-rhamnosidase C-terminal domain-containing protein [Tepidisphaeraceae bacterium]|jgi:hypothetical protein
MTDPRTRTYVPAVAVHALPSAALPAGAGRLVGESAAWATIWREPLCTLSRGVEGRPDAIGLLLDFGRELHGGVRLIVRKTAGNKPVRLRVALGESLSEALGAPNQDHAINDHTVLVPLYGEHEVGNTGFRFARVELLDGGASAELLGVAAVSLMRRDPVLGRFECSDARLNRVWQVGLDTVHLCMQGHVWDGIKRDRLVWAGDLHPEIVTILHSFGGHPIIEESLNFVRDETPLPSKWMNGMPPYSVWWVISWHEHYLHTGDLRAVADSRAYLTQLLTTLAGMINDAGEETLPSRFLDWATFYDKPALAAGSHALLRMGLAAGAALCDALGERGVGELCRAAADRAGRWTPSAVRNQQANALRVLAGLADAGRTNAEVFAVDPTHNLSPFYGYYVLEARAAAGDYAGALDLIRRYWGAMLDLGATSFWEHFDMDWLKNNPTGIDAFPVDGRPDVHRDCGDHCYVGYRHSLCHGWSSGPTPWLMRHVLGVTPAAPGYAQVRIAPQLAGLTYARGTVPTPRGPIEVDHRVEGGRVVSEVKLPAGAARV